MNSSLRFSLLPLLCLSVFPGFLASAFAQSWRYQLIEGSQLLDECPPCARPSLALPMRGGFSITPETTPAPLERFRIHDLSFTAGSHFGRFYQVTGQGTYEIFSEFAIIERLYLELTIDDGNGPRLCLLTNAPAKRERRWPMLKLSAIQTNGTFTQVYHLDLAAAPFQELWYSLKHGLHNGNWSFPTNGVSGGDLLALDGHIVHRSRDLLAKFQLTPEATQLDPDPGLDAIDIWPGGEIAFSIYQPVVSGALGKTLQPGSLLSDGGSIIALNPSLTRAFGFMPPVPDLGLDAVHRLENGELYFSIETEQFSEQLGVQIGRGDVLSDSGRLIRRSKELLEHFHPIGPGKDYGLDALYIWPSGEIWFSTEISFQDEQLSHVGEGDLLSDQGYVVLRHQELVGPFAPLEDLADFGLDGLFVLTDVGARDTKPQITKIQKDPATNELRLDWEGKGRVFQVERSIQVAGPYQAAAPPSTKRFFLESGPSLNAPSAYYRVRQW
ncbi:MAG: hypothetical protein JNN07_27880 [Verrucomicrobiales bacterium]|nr:hypothetical protein [Verrucomicrobiales bacterium]